MSSSHEDSARLLRSLSLEDEWSERWSALDGTEVPEWFADYVDERLTPERRRDCELRLESDAELRERFDEYRRCVSLLSETAGDVDPCADDLRDRIRSALLHASSPEPVSLRSERARRRWPLLASVAVGAASLALYFTQGPGRSIEPEGTTVVAPGEDRETHGLREKPDLWSLGESADGADGAADARGQGGEPREKKAVAARSNEANKSKGAKSEGVRAMRAEGEDALGQPRAPRARASTPKPAGAKDKSDSGSDEKAFASRTEELKERLRKTRDDEGTSAQPTVEIAKVAKKAQTERQGIGPAETEEFDEAAPERVAEAKKLGGGARYAGQARRRSGARIALDGETPSPDSLVAVIDLKGSASLLETEQRGVQLRFFAGNRWSRFDDGRLAAFRLALQHLGDDSLPKRDPDLGPGAKNARPRADAGKKKDARKQSKVAKGPATGGPSTPGPQGTDTATPKAGGAPAAETGTRGGLPGKSREGVDPETRKKDDRRGLQQRDEVETADRRRPSGATFGVGFLKDARPGSGVLLELRGSPREVARMLQNLRGKGSVSVRSLSEVLGPQNRARLFAPKAKSPQPLALSENAEAGQRPAEPPEEEALGRAGTKRERDVVYYVLLQLPESR